MNLSETMIESLVSHAKIDALKDEEIYTPRIYHSVNTLEALWKRGLIDKRSRWAYGEITDKGWRVVEQYVPTIHEDIQAMIDKKKAASAQTEYFQAKRKEIEAFVKLTLQDPDAWIRASDTSSMSETGHWRVTYYDGPFVITCEATRINTTFHFDSLADYEAARPVMERAQKINDYLADHMKEHGVWPL